MVSSLGPVLRCQNGILIWAVCDEVSCLGAWQAVCDSSVGVSGRSQPESALYLEDKTHGNQLSILAQGSTFIVFHLHLDIPQLPNKQNLQTS
jgi:hypothetical protein